MKDFELRKIKSFAEMSEETEAFKAELWVDGKHIADVKNDGRGGCNDIRPIRPFTWKDVEPYRTMDVETQIFSMVIEFDETRKKQSKGFFLRKGPLSMDCEYFTQKFPMPVSKLRKASNYAGWLQTKLKNFEAQGYTVLNTNL